MIIHRFANRFNVMKNNGNHIQYVLDIGAYRGDFTETVLSVWPTALITQIEADERQKNWLSPNAIIALLGDAKKDSVNFYTISEEKSTTGSSIFKELTYHYTESTTIILKKEMTTIDALDEQYNFRGLWSEYGLLKLDTQGSELLILDGAKKFLSEKKPRYILLETSVVQYNEGAPMIFNYMNYMNDLGYKVVDIFDIAYGDKNQIMQIDLLWEKA